MSFSSFRRVFFKKKSFIQFALYFPKYEIYANFSSTAQKGGTGQDIKQGIVGNPGTVCGPSLSCDMKSKAVTQCGLLTVRC